MQCTRTRTAPVQTLRVTSNALRVCNQPYGTRTRNGSCTGAADILGRLPYAHLCVCVYPHVREYIHNIRMKRTGPAAVTRLRVPMWYVCVCVCGLGQRPPHAPALPCEPPGRSAQTEHSLNNLVGWGSAYACVCVNSTRAVRVCVCDEM